MSPCSIYWQRIQTPYPVGWEVVEWQRVTNFDKSAENYFVRILLLGRDGGGTRERVHHLEAERRPRLGGPCGRHKEGPRDSFSCGRRLMPWAIPFFKPLL